MAFEPYQAPCNHETRDKNELVQAATTVTIVIGGWYAAKALFNRAVRHEARKQVKAQQSTKIK